MSNMSVQEAQVQLGALAREVEGQERAVESWTEQLTDAEKRGDKEEVSRLGKEIDGANRTIRVANEQMAALSGTARSKRQRAQQR